MAILKRRKSGLPNPTLRGRETGIHTNFALVHVTQTGAMREIIRSGMLETRTCPVFGRHLLYFFALRPAYKLRGSEEKRSIVDYFPSVLLLDAADFGAPVHVYPFDTGGAVGGAFDDGASPFFYLEDYQLNETQDAVGDHIAWAFDNRADYFDAKLKKDFAKLFPAWEVGPLSFAKIANLASSDRNRPDRRASAIELAFDEQAPLDRVRLVLFPHDFMEDPLGHNHEVIDALAKAGVPWLTYEWRANRTPAEFQGDINAIVRDFLLDRGDLA